jgi:hypothetical protein
LSVQVASWLRGEGLELAKQLGNVSQACKMMGYSRDSFYRVKALRNTSDARRHAAKLCCRFGPLTPSARSANLIAGDGTWRNRSSSAA